MNKVNKLALTLVTGAAFLAGSGSAAAATTGVLTVSAQVAGACSISNATIDAGPIDATSSSPTDFSGTVDVTCTSGTNATIELDAGGGGGASASISNRYMNDGSSHFMAYHLYSDESRTSNWGDIASGGDVAYTGNGANKPVTVYGRIDGGQYELPVGSYSDTVNMTITIQ